MSVIVPAYNEQKTISGLLEKLYTSLSASKFSFLIIVVDDGSSDCTLEDARTTLQRLTTANNYQVMPSPCNQGKGSAIRQGLQYASSDYVIIQDADLEYEPDDIVTMLETAKAQNLDVLYGSRFLIASNQHSYRRFYWGGQIVSFFSNFLYRQRLTDEPTCYKLFRTDLLKSLDLKCTGFEFCPEATAKVAKKGYKIPEIPIHYHPRSIEEGKKISWKDGITLPLSPKNRFPIHLGKR